MSGVGAAHYDDDDIAKCEADCMTSPVDVFQLRTERISTLVSELCNVHMGLCSVSVV